MSRARTPSSCAGGGDRDNETKTEVRETDRGRGTETERETLTETHRDTHRYRHTHLLPYLYACGLFPEPLVVEHVLADDLRKEGERKHLY